VERVSASAGTGKTWALALRYLSLLLRFPAPVEAMPKVLAVTFTNKAAREMKERILAWLESLSRSCGGEASDVRRELARATGLQEAEIGVRAGALLPQIYLRWPSFAVGTIDSFLTAAARASAHELDFPFSFEVALRSDPLFRRALKDLLRRASREEGLRREMEAVFREWLQAHGDTEWDLLERFAEDQRALRARLMGLPVLPEAGEEGPRPLQEALEAVGQAARDFLGRIADAGIQIRNGQSFLQKLQALAGDPSERNLEAAQSDFWKKCRLVDAVKKDSKPSVGSAEEEAWESLRRSIAEAAWLLARGRGDALLRFQSRLASALEERARQEGVVLLEEIPRRLSRFFAGGGVPSVYLALGERIQHLLVDEFQDTSEGQWAALEPLAEEALSQGGSLFFVGDTKQAIYRFRGGAPHLFHSVFTDLYGRFGGADRPSTTNYRSRKVLVEAFNEFFSKEVLQKWACGKAGVALEDFEETIWPFFQSPVQEARREGGYLRVETLSPSEESQEEEASGSLAERAVKDVLPGLLARGYLPRDVAFLVRTNGEAAAVAQVLESRGHRASTESAARVTTRPVVQELLALLRFLESPTDDLSFAAFAGGSLMERASSVPPAELHGLLARWASARGGALYRAYREAFPRPWAALVEPLFQGVGYLPPYDLLRDFLERAKAFDTFPEEEAFLCHFLEVVSRKEGEGAATVGSLLQALEEDPEDESLEVPLPEGGDAFRVMTIHKAKGLGFPVVILLDPALRRPSVSEVLVEEGRRVRWLRFTKAMTELCPRLEREKSKEKVLRLRDELCTFYVALTRAEEELYVFLKARQNNGSRLAPPLPPFLERGSPGSPDKPPAVSTRIPERRPPRSSWKERILPAADRTFLPPPFESLSAVRMGKLIHGALEAGFRGEAEDERILTALGASDEEVREASTRLRALKDHPHIGSLLRPPAGEVLNEVEFLDGEGRIFRVDRLIVEKDRITVVDWKTGLEESPGHREQVAKYCRILSALYPDREIRGRLAYLTLERVEEVPW
jgi:ATP-dependent exoDNAse (exonuclease V) beta subunit